MKREKKLRFGGGGIWSIVLESQLFPTLAWLASLVIPGKTAGLLLPGLFFSHAARVAGSTGHVSGGVSVSFDMLRGSVSGYESLDFDDAIEKYILESGPALDVRPLW